MTTSIYQKTEKGQDEIRTRAHHLDHFFSGLRQHNDSGMVGVQRQAVARVGIEFRLGGQAGIRSHNFAEGVNPTVPGRTRRSSIPRLPRSSPFAHG